MTNYITSFEKDLIYPLCSLIYRLDSGIGLNLFKKQKKIGINKKSYDNNQFIDKDFVT